MRTFAAFTLCLLLSVVSFAQNIGLKGGIATTAIGSGLIVAGGVTIGVGLIEGVDTGNGKTKVIIGSAMGAIGLAGSIVGISAIVKALPDNRNLSLSSTSNGLTLTYTF